MTTDWVLFSICWLGSAKHIVICALKSADLLDQYGNSRSYLKQFEKMALQHLNHWILQSAWVKSPECHCCWEKQIGSNWSHLPQQNQMAFFLPLLSFGGSCLFDATGFSGTWGTSIVCQKAKMEFWWNVNIPEEFFLLFYEFDCSWNDDDFHRWLY